jgi:ubiquinone/menaquinone biosynthesis C-methylase UbiE
MISTRLAFRALRLALAGRTADPVQDYDAASADYDSFFTPVMGAHSAAALDRVTVKPGQTVVELACGTGHLTRAISARMEGRGRIRAVDMSRGMLAVARDKVAATPQLDVTFSQGDMTAFLRGLPDAGTDVVVCGWAICYGRPVALLREIRRVLRPGGEVVIVETRADALSALMRPLERVFSDDPSLLTGLVRVSLPKNAEVVRRWFARAGLDVTHAGEGAEVLPVATPDAALEWVQRSGAAAGFKDAVAADREAEVLARLRDALADQVSRSGPLRIAHTFVVVAGARPAGGGQP